MAARHGTRLWPCYASLSRPLTLMGVERTGFILSATLGLAMWNALNSILTGGAVFLLLSDLRPYSLLVERGKSR